MGRKNKKNRAKNIVKTEQQPVKKKTKLKIDFRISGFVNELVKRLHKEHPNTEWSGIARIVKQNGYYEVVDIKFPEQENTSTTTELTETGLSDLLEDIFDENPHSMGEYNCRIHSHHTMSCFWSGTDDTAKESFNDGNTDYWFSIVTAYKGQDIDYRVALGIFKPVSIEFDNIPYKVGKYNKEENIENYAAYKMAIDSIEREEERALQEAMEKTEDITEEEIQQVVDILNSNNGEEERAVIRKLILERKETTTESVIEIIEDKFKKAKDEINNTFGCDIFDKKVKELKENIVKPKYGGFMGGDGRGYNRASQYSKQKTLSDDWDNDYYQGDRKRDKIERKRLTWNKQVGYYI